MKTKIGIIGGGQLARMMAEPARKLNSSLIVLDPTPHSPGGQKADKQITADFNDENALLKLATLSDVITIEIEVANEEGLAKILKKIIKNGTPVQPDPSTLEIIQDKFKQKEFLKKAQIQTPDFVEIASLQDIKKAAELFGYPMLLKARTGAYDGRGNALITKEADIQQAMHKLKDKKLYIEKFVPFTKELAVIVARNTKGEVTAFPVVETIHKDNILHVVLAPARVSQNIATLASTVGIHVIEQFNGAGVFGIEMFLTKDGTVLVNEIAPRVHNSGHLTIEANKTSQFEQHLRAITGMPLGSTEMIIPAAVMINILGNRDGKAVLKGIRKAKNIPGVFVHIYGKLETRKMRKMGHITVIDDSIDTALEKAKMARNIISI